jgi:glycosyltransferase involved in cell wall biosynthesis
MNNNCHIAILLPDLQIGGAEKLHIALANELISRNYKITFILYKRRGDLLGDLFEGIEIHELNAENTQGSIFPLIKYFRNNDPGLLIVAMWPLTFMAPLVAFISRFKGKILISEHEPLLVSHKKLGYLHNIFLRLTVAVGYRLAHLLVAVSTGVAKDMSKLSLVDEKKINIIHNPVVKKNGASFDSLPNQLNKRGLYKILSVGTLSKVKRHDLLLRAFSKLNIDESVLCILGDGPERKELESLAHDLGIEKRVFMPGYIIDPSPWYSKADLFVLSSDYEGFGNVIVEALDYGIPVIATNCPYGPSEILVNGEYGTLVPVGDVDALSDAIRSELSKEHDHEKLKFRARQFSVDKIANQYIGLYLSRKHK